MNTDPSPFIEYVLSVFDENFIPKRSQFLTVCLRIRNRHYLLQKLGQVLWPKESIPGGGGSQTFGFGSPNE